jgi:predicted  nucleic acid-binding Zn-ribbon protein
MRTRHRIPSIFNLSMVDVLCCALGCVILLWLLNLREAKQRAELADRASTELARTRTDLERTTGEAAATRTRLQSAEQDRDRVRDELAMTAANLDKQNEARRALEADLAAARKRVAALQADLKEKETLARSTARDVEHLAERLRGAEARAKQLQGQADLLPGAREEATALRGKLDQANVRMATLEKDIAARKQELAGTGRSLHDLEMTNAELQKELTAGRQRWADAGRQIGALVGENKNLQEQARRARAAADNRFAGISLTGRRVVFLVDMSGSMELTDERTPAPGKWRAVRDTLRQIMKSLPDLEKFQVILFADRVVYPLGSEGRWINADAQGTDRVVQTLSAIRPQGNTDLYSAFDAAFRLRDAGLDTIYLLSDGLPNVGPGLTPTEAQTMRESEKSEVLSKVLRRALLTDWNRQRPDRPRVRINAVGFFYESPDVGAFLWALAREHDGSFVGMSRP